MKKPDLSKLKDDFNKALDDHKDKGTLESEIKVRDALKKLSDAINKIAIERRKKLRSIQKVG